MKIALYIEDGLEQIVLTPESATERNILGKLHDGARELTLKRGSFFECAGGYIRTREHVDDSTMIVLRRPTAREAAASADGHEHPVEQRP